MTPDVGHLEGRTIFITGGTGSLGHTLAAAILDHTREARVTVYSRGESRQAEMAEEFSRHRDRLRMRLGDVRDRDRLELALWRVDIVVHAAALKRVDDTARHPEELIKTNVLGTQNVLRAALTTGVRRILLVSSDKGVEAANPYGGTKFLAEQLVTAWNAVGYARGQLSSCVRYGNVLSSTGSVAHAFRHAAQDGEVASVTEGGMTRFWMTRDEAAALVCRCLRLMRGGEVFVPKLPSAPVEALARAMGAPGVRLVPKRPGGEKAHETLLSEHESHRAVDVGDLFVVEPDWELPVDREPWKGEALPAGFSYRSDTAPRLSLDALAEMGRV